MAANAARNASSMSLNVISFSSFYFGSSLKNSTFVASVHITKYWFVSIGLACSGPFWKKMESIFASVSSDDLSYLKQQVVMEIKV